MVRDMLLERVGATTEEHETFVNATEYNSWVKRQRIIRFLINGDGKNAKSAINEYENDGLENDCVGKQFILAVKAMQLALDDCVAIEYIEKAISLTYPHYSTCDLNGISLSSKELCLSLALC